MKEYYLIQEVAEIFSVSESTIRRLIRDEKLGTIRIRGCIRIPLKDIEKLKKRRKSRSTVVRNDQPDLHFRL